MSSLIEILAEETSLSPADLLAIARTAPRRYKTFSIPKRSGGLRLIAQPSRELKIIQRAIVTRILQTLPVHECATAYRKGGSIADNAKVHAGGLPILKMDFEDFFPSIQSSDWVSYCRQKEILSGEDLDLSVRYLFRQARGDRHLKLAIGAPSSPMLSNIMMHEFDAVVFDQAAAKRISYTRYADDMTFSGQRIGMLKDMIGVVTRATRQMSYPHLRINNKKTLFATRKNRRVVTGIVLTNDGDVSLGRDRKRNISARLHRASLGKLSPDERAELRGLLAFANVVEPDFLVRLQARYGTATFDAVYHQPVMRDAPSTPDQN